MSRAQIRWHPRLQRGRKDYVMTSKTPAMTPRTERGRRRKQGRPVGGENGTV